MIGTVYLLCFGEKGLESRPGCYARHYLGWTLNVDARVREHLSGRGSPLVAAAVARGLPVELVRTWPGTDRHFERALKRRREGPRLCPACHAAGRARALLDAPAPSTIRPLRRIAPGHWASRDMAYELLRHGRVWQAFDVHGRRGQAGVFVLNAATLGDLALGLEARDG